MPINKRKDPNYRKVEGYIPKDLKQEFRHVLVELEMDATQGIEEAIRRLILSTREEKEGATTSDQSVITFLRCIAQKDKEPTDELLTNTAKETGIDKESLKHLINRIYRLE